MLQCWLNCAPRRGGALQEHEVERLGFGGGERDRAGGGDSRRLRLSRRLGLNAEPLCDCVGDLPRSLLIDGDL